MYIISEILTTQQTKRRQALYQYKLKIYSRFLSLSKDLSSQKYHTQHNTKQINNLVDKCIKIRIGMNTILGSKTFSLFSDGIEYSNHTDAIHHLGFRNRTMGSATASNNAQAINHLTFFTQHGATNTFSPWQVNHIAVFVQIIKLPYPIASNSKDVYIILLNIINLLSKIIFNENFISIAFYSLDPFNTLFRTFSLPRPRSKLSLVTPTIKKSQSCLARLRRLI